MMALAATVLFTATACGGDDDKDIPGGDKGTNVELTGPAYKDAACILNITGNNADGIRQLRMMESGTYMITRNGAATRAGGDPVYDFGNYSYSSGQYKFDNGMIISYESSGKDCEVTITWKNGTTIKTTGTLDPGLPVTAGVATDNLCSRAWTIERVIAKGTVDKVTLGKEFQGPIDLAKVKAWYEENYGKLKDQFNANTIIEGIHFDSKGLFAINYKNRDDDIGVWRWQQIDQGKLVYTWNDKMRAISLFTGNASVTFEKNPETLKLTLSGNVNGTDLEFLFILH